MQVPRKKNMMKRFIGLVLLRTEGRIPEDCKSTPNKKINKWNINLTKKIGKKAKTKKIHKDLA